ncbi:tail fiber domain-containing protein [Burkholderia cepacia]|uniref:tail fiber domain-containing protein n=1 Tax=Burkholderia cepacia TaxID=292 RepID=UPI000759F6C8|nr:tail fiber domain-containing protein [Burkholderia cepacia]KWH57887.1 hypothetical protein WM00_10400 [Burkholderia cepacia]
MALTTVQKIDRLGVDSDLLHGVVHGPASGPGSSVETEGGSVPTVAKAVADAKTSMQSQAASQLVQVQAASNAAIAQMQALAGAQGYKVPVTYAAGINLSEANQTVEYGGRVYAPLASVLPFTTTGTFEAEKFRLIQGVVVTDLSANGGAALVGYMPAAAGDTATTVQAKLQQLDKIIAYPSYAPGNSYCDVVVPNSGVFTDNIISLANMSQNGAWQGNSALRLCNHLLKEKAAVGYSRTASNTVGGWYPNLAYIEGGNLYDDDPDDTDVAIVLTKSANARNFPGTSVKRLEVSARSGDTYLRTQGAGDVYVESSNSGVIGPAGLMLRMRGSFARLRERRLDGQFAITTNISPAGPAEAQDDPTKASYSLDFGGGDDTLTIRRAAPGTTVVGDAMDVLLTVDGRTGRLLLNQTVNNSGGGADGMLGVTGGGSGRSAMTLRQTDGLPALVCYNSGTTGDLPLVSFGTEGSFTARGNITYQRSSGLVQYNTTSDGTLKTKIGAAPVETSKALIMATPISEWYWNDDVTKKKQVGPIAQELYESGFIGAVHVGGMQDVVEPVYEDVMGDVDVPIVEEIETDAYVVDGVETVTRDDGSTLEVPRRKVLVGQGPKVKVITGTKTINTKIGQRQIGTKKVGEVYDPWSVDKTAFSFHLVVLAQDHENRLASAEKTISEQQVLIGKMQETIDAMKAKIGS